MGTKFFVATLLLCGFALTANAEHEDGHAKCERKHSWQDADKNKDGAVSKDEFMASHQERAEKMFTKLDANKDGKVDQAERKEMKNRCERHNAVAAPK